jgi:hypothetical protein
MRIETLASFGGEQSLSPHSPGIEKYDRQFSTDECVKHRTAIIHKASPSNSSSTAGNLMMAKSHTHDTQSTLPWTTRIRGPHVWYSLESESINTFLFLYCPLCMQKPWNADRTSNSHMSSRQDSLDRGSNRSNTNTGWRHASAYASKGIRTHDLGMSSYFTLFGHCDGTKF